MSYHTLGVSSYCGFQGALGGQRTKFPVPGSIHVYARHHTHLLHGSAISNDVLKQYIPRLRNFTSPQSLALEISASMPLNGLFGRIQTQAQWDALLTCIVTSLILNACLHYALSPFRTNPYFIAYVCAGRACVSVVWLKLYQRATGERGLDPFLNIAITFLAPILAERWWA